MDLDQALAMEKHNESSLTSHAIEKQIHKAFHFCYAAHYAIKNGDISTRRLILSHFGSNQRLLGKNLYVDVYGWFLAVKKGASTYAKEFEKLELEKVSNDKLRELNCQFFL